MGDWYPTTVQCYSGYKADERPLSFRAGDRELKVLRIVDSHRDPDLFYFKVQADDGELYLLKRLQREDTWMVMKLKNTQVRKSRHNE